MAKITSFQKHSIELKLGATVDGLNTSDKSLSLSGGEKISYDALLIATGSM
jgi:NAD(P)H-nitrite reductase large subunit